MAQRLVRKVCRRCAAAPPRPTDSELRAMNVDPPGKTAATFMMGMGCNALFGHRLPRPFRRLLKFL